MSTQKSSLEESMSLDDEVSFAVLRQLGAPILRVPVQTCVVRFDCTLQRPVQLGSGLKTSE